MIRENSRPVQDTFKKYLDTDTFSKKFLDTDPECKFRNTKLDFLTVRENLADLFKILSKSI